VVEQPWPLIATVAIIVVGKSVAAFAIVRAFRHQRDTALTISASLAQIGEFSFILAGLGTGLGILPPEGRDLILAGAILSIFLNPFVFGAVAGRSAPRSEATTADAEAAERERERERREHIILVGYGRVGTLVAAGAREDRRALVIIEDQPDTALLALEDGFTVTTGSAAEPRTLAEAGIAEADRLIIAIPEGFEAGVIAERARQANPALVIFARAHSDEEVDYLTRHGVDHVVMGEREIARRLNALVTASRQPKR
jgi:CPA2 family monovalent cation:H+ antiporter-2